MQVTKTMPPVQQNVNSTLSACVGTFEKGTLNLYGNQNGLAKIKKAFENPDTEFNIADDFKRELKIEDLKHVCFHIMSEEDTSKLADAIPNIIEERKKHLQTQETENQKTNEKDKKKPIHTNTPPVQQNITTGASQPKPMSQEQKIKNMKKLHMDISCKILGMIKANLGKEVEETFPQNHVFKEMCSEKTLVEKTFMSEPKQKIRYFDAKKTHLGRVIVLPECAKEDLEKPDDQRKIYAYRCQKVFEKTVLPDLEKRKNDLDEVSKKIYTRLVDLIARAYMEDAVSSNWQEKCCIMAIEELNLNELEKSKIIQTAAISCIIVSQNSRNWSKFFNRSDIWEPSFSWSEMKGQSRSN